MGFYPFQPSGGGGGAVDSVFGRTGTVTAQAGDYTVAKVTGAAPLASPAFTDTPTAPTAAPGTGTTQLATTAYADTAAAERVAWLLPSGDTSGAPDAAAIQSAYTALGGAPGVIKLAPVAPWYIEGGDTAPTPIVIPTPGVYVDIEGCFIHQTGAGIGIDMSQPTSDRSVNGGGIVGYGIMDGGATTGDSSPYKVGDIFQMTMEVQSQNYTAGTESKLGWFVNRSSWTEDLTGRIFGANGTQGFVFDHAAGGASSTGSFDGLNMVIEVDQSDDSSFPGVSFLNGANCQRGVGAGLTVVGNFGADVTPPTAAVLTIDGQSPVGTGDAGTFSAYQNSALYLAAECDGTAGETGPVCIAFGSSGNNVSQCYGAINLLNVSGAPFGDATGVSDNFDFSGPINGAGGLSNSYVMSVLDTSFANFFGEGAGGPSQLSADANNLLINTDPLGLVSYLQQSQPAHTASVGSTATETAVVTLSVPGGDVTQGAVYRLSGFATAVIGATAPTLTWAVRWGGTTGTLLAVTAAITETASSTGIWEFEAEVAFPSDTSTATAMLKLLYNLASTSETAGRYGAGTTGVAVETAGITCDTADDADLVLTAKFSAADSQSLTVTGRAERVS